MRLNQFTANFGDELSASDVRRSLYDALSDKYPDTVYGGCSAWIEDYFPESKQLIFTYGGDTWRQSYELAETGEATLVDTPEKVTARTVYEPASMGEVELTVAEFGSDGTAIFSGKVFQAGKYPGQKITMSADDNARACETFTPVKIKDTHNEHQSVFSGKLGSWTEATASGSDVFAKLSMPAPLLALFGADWKPKVSVEIDRITKRFSAIALLNHPQVTDAQVAAAFESYDAEFAGARHSKGDSKAIQNIHDLAVGQGAACTPTDATMGVHDPARATTPTAKEKSMKKPTPWERILALFGKEKVDALGTTEEQLNAAFAETEAVTDPELAAQVAKFSAETAAMRIRVLGDEAAKFATDLVYTQRKAHPSQIEHLKGMYLTAVAKDGDGGQAMFGEDGQIKTGDAMKELISYFEKAERLPSTFGQQIPDQKPDAKDTDAAARAQRRLAGATNAYNKGGLN